ncbi:MAG: RimK family alpha-L-glutamate ligase [Spirochaetia bacterium]|nr:RimK family alpha-L-glutamate ligase [Spirochaetia bacterium]
MSSVKSFGEPAIIYILSNARSLYSTRRFFEEGIKRGHKVKVFPPVALTLSIERNACRVYFQKQILPRPDIIIPRVGQRNSGYTMAVIKQFEMMNVITLNSTQAIAKSRNKLRSLQILAQNNIPVPRTFFIDNISEIDIAIEGVGGAPVIIKLTEGTQGMGVMLAETARSARSILESLISQGQNVLIQEFIGESTGRDLRAIVLNNKVVASMQRMSIGDEFRSNVHRGGSHHDTRLSIESEKLSRLAAKILGLSFAGVDLIESKRGPLILEVNPSPGIEGIEGSTGTNIAQQCIMALEKEFRLRPKNLDQKKLS